MSLKQKGLAAFVLLYLFIISGCETTKGIVNGVKEGVPKDAKNTWEAVKKADDWLKDHAW